MALNSANATNSGQYVVATDDRSSQQSQQQQHQAIMQHHQQQMNNAAVAMAAAANNGNLAAATTTSAASSLTTFALMGLSGPLHFPGVAAAQHLNTTPTPVPPAIPGPQPISTKIPVPAIFQGKKMRFGKWTAEEEEYCDLLIKQFENGWMEGCENGCTLRSFLARKLHCAPMRISKKYAGRGIGKMIFLAKTNSTNGVLTMTEAQLAENAVKLRDAEGKFYKSIYPNINMFQVANRTPVDNPVMHPPCFNPMAQLVPSSQPVTFFPVQTAATSAPAPVNNCTNAAPAPAAQATPTNQPGNVTLGSPWPGLQGPPGAAPAAAASQAATSANANHINDLHNTLQQSYLNALHHLQQGTAPVQGVAPNQGAPTEQQEPVTGLVVVPAPAAASAAHRSNVSEIPDFLSGFERVAAVAAKETNNTSTHNAVLPKEGSPWVPVTPHIATATDSTSTEQHSPPFTSKSFDEFHRLLGKDLSPLQKVENMQAKVSEAVRIPPTESLSQGTSITAAATDSTGQSLGRPVTIAPRNDTKEYPTSFTADSYALFAQESARAVSEHSAYSLSNGLHRLLAPPQQEELPVQPPISTSKPRDFMTLTTTNANHNSNNHNNSSSSRSGERNEFFAFQPALESASAFLSHIYKTSHHSNIVSGSEESGSARGGSGVDSTTGSDNASNDSDSNSEDGPYHKKLKINHNGDCMTANGDNDRDDMSPFS